MTERIDMKKGQVYEGIIESVEFPNKGRIYLPEEDSALSTMKMQMEDFYVAEKDADILIYNGTIEGELTSVDELIAKNSLFADFKAVKSGQVYTTGSNFYQQTSMTCDFIEDLNKVLIGSDDTDYHFLKHIQ